MGGRGSQFKAPQAITAVAGTPSGFTLADVQKMDDKSLHDFLIDVDKTDMPAFLNDIHLQKMIYALGMNEPPEIVSDTQMQKLINNGAVPIYRTVNDTSVSGIPFTSKDICDMLLEGDTTYVGNGVHGDGLYFSDNLNRSRGVYGGATAKTMTGVLNAKAKVISEASLKAKYDSFIKNHPQTRKALGFARDHGSSWKNSLSQFALTQGYNVISYKNYSNETYYTVLDRSVLTMTKTLK